MAVYQFQIYFIPKQSLIQKVAYIPTELKIDNENWANHIQNADLENAPDFKDALTIKWWLDLNIDINVLRPLLRQFGEIQDWTESAEGLISWGEAESNDITVCFEKLTNSVEEISCRLDLRLIDQSFINNILSLATDFDCLLMDRQGRLFQPTSNALFDSIQLSNSNRFVRDPLKFLDDLDKGVIKPE